MVKKRIVGVLALQGDFAEHLEALRQCGVEGVEVRTARQLGEVDALIIPGGESTTMLKLIDRFDLRDPVIRRIEEGLPTFGTCAGAIVLASEVGDGEKPLEVLDLSLKRNAYGSQVESFECELEVRGVGAIQGIFIRAPSFEKVGDGVEVLAELEGRPVLVRSGKILASAFHPEISGNVALHRYFLEEVAS